MKNKKIVYFDENQQDKTVPRAPETASKKNLSISKGLRETSTNKHQKNMLQGPRLSGTDKSGAQKIKILLIKDGFIFQKKYMIYDIQCTLLKKTDFKYQISEYLPNQPKQENKAQFDQGSLPSQKSDQDYLFLNLETSSFGVTRGMVRHNFPIEKDSSNYIQVRTPGYVIQNIMIYNKKIEFIQFDQEQFNDQNDVTIIQPIKLIQQTQYIRQAKLQAYYQRRLECRKSKSLNFCWNLDTVIQNVQVNLRQSLKKGQPQWASLFNTTNSSIVSPPINLQNISRDRSDAKRLSNYGAGDKTWREGSKTTRDNNPQKFNVTQIMKLKQTTSKMKTSSRKMLAETGLNYGAHSKVTGKQNKKQDVYGLQQLNHRKTRTKTAQNEQIHKIIQPLQLAQCQFKMGQFEINRYGLIKKPPQN